MGEAGQLARGGMNVRPRVPIGALVVAALVLYALARWDAAIGSRDAEIIADARRLLSLSKPFHARIARLAAIRDSALADAARARSGAQALDVRIDRQLSDTTIIGLRLRFPPLDSLLAAYDERDALRLREIRARELAFGAESYALRLSVPRIGQLEYSLGRVVEIADCHMLGIRWLPRCPSRTVAFFGGSGIGFVVGLLVGS